MTKVSVVRRYDGQLIFNYPTAGVEHALVAALSFEKFMWFEYHWPNGTMERSMEGRKIHSQKYDPPEEDGRPKAASYPKYVVFED